MPSSFFLELILGRCLLVAIDWHILHPSHCSNGSYDHLNCIGWLSLQRSLESLLTRSSHHLTYFGISAFQLGKVCSGRRLPVLRSP